MLVLLTLLTKLTNNRLTMTNKVLYNISEKCFIGSSAGLLGARRGAATT